MAVTRELLPHILAFLFPPVCLACKRLGGVESLPLALCSLCRQQLRPIAGACCVACLRPLSERPKISDNRCLGCRRRSSALDRVLAGWSYQPPLDAVVHALKFGRLEFLGRHLAAALHELHWEDLQEIDVVVPIPLHWSRRMRRGYNQAEAIAAPLARRVRLPLWRVLRRRRFTRPQARLPRRQRATNLRLAFAPFGRRAPAVADRRILLVDDVVTTGATLEAAAACLRECGARSVTALTAGRTPTRIAQAPPPSVGSFDTARDNLI